MKNIIFTLFLLLFIVSCNQDNHQKFVTIGTGGVTGVYYPTGGAISRMINKKTTKYKIKATVESTSGSVYNINSVLNGNLQFGIAQSDRQFQAVHGKKEWKEKGAQKNLRSVFSIHPESVTLVASVKSNITKMADLENKKVNLGNPGSGQLSNSKDVLEALSLNEKDIKAEYVKAIEAPSLLQDERLDAFFYTVGHPNGNIKEATSGRVKVKIISLSGDKIDALIAKYPYYTKTIIPKALYPNAVLSNDVTTFGVRATLITSSKVNENVVYAITKEVFENFEKFKKLHPTYQVLTKKNMLQGLSAPIHSGAKKYYKEAGLIKYINSSLL